MRSYQGSQSRPPLLIRLIVISSLNHRDATYITGRPWTLQRVQTVMGISIDIGLKGSVSLLFTLQASQFPIYTETACKWASLPGAPTLWWSLRKYKAHYCLMPHKILTSPFHRRGGHTRLDGLIVCGIFNQCLLNDKFPHAHSQCRVKAVESIRDNWIYIYLSFIKWFSHYWQIPVTFPEGKMDTITAVQAGQRVDLQ